MSTQKILIIDDDPTMCNLITANVIENGYLSLEAYDGEDGIKLAREEKPDCIVLDWSLPGMDGMEVLQALKNNKETKDIPVIMLTAKTEISNVSESLSLGAYDYIVKPFDHENFQTRLKRALDKS